MTRTNTSGVNGQGSHGQTEDIIMHGNVYILYNIKKPFVTEDTVVCGGGDCMATDRTCVKQ